jgi:hypothetical protein
MTVYHRGVRRTAIARVACALMLVGWTSSSPVLALEAPRPTHVPTNPWTRGPDAAGLAAIDGVIDAPAAGGIVTLGGSKLGVAGWVVDGTADGWAGIDKVQIYAGEIGKAKLLAEATVGQSRPDVAKALGNGFYDRSGFSAQFDAQALSLGPQTLYVYAHTPSRGWWFRTVTVEVVQSICENNQIQVEMDPWSIDRSGFSKMSGEVRNNCSTAIDVEVNIQIRGGSQSGTRIATAQTAWVTGVPADGSTRFSTTVDGLLGYATYWQHYWWTVSDQSDDRTGACWNVGATRCLRGDSALGGAVWQLYETSTGQRLLRLGADAGVVLQRERMPIGAYGLFERSANRITIDTRLYVYSAWERASVLSHELQHAADFAAGKHLDTPAGCFDSEEDAFVSESLVWLELWDTALPPARNSVQRDLNNIVVTIALDPYAFLSNLLIAYKHQCADA